ncbi:MAG: glycosyltransferase family 4 protein, partial [Propionibacteriaceae bacterium]|nr:glycosyltransferase family 4 protein [Propionibacteriaceae bacterium]
YPNVDPSVIHVVRNGIDTDEFYPDAGLDFPTQIGMDPDRPSVVFVGRITRQKGLVHLLAAARQFAPGVQLVLLASSPDTPEIAQQFDQGYQALVAERGDDVIWVKDMAPRAGVREVLTHATVFACPSIYEPLGIVNLEAMACQTAVVASAVGGIPEVVDDTVTGLLVSYDPEQEDDPAYAADFEARFAGRVNELVGDSARVEAMGAAGRQRCIDEFSWEAIAAQTVDVYQAAIDRYASR